ncbi:MAG: polysaccharide biosynthesis/export family protein, partial [Nitrospiria bacterium]
MDRGRSTLVVFCVVSFSLLVACGGISIVPGPDEATESFNFSASNEDQLLASISPSLPPSLAGEESEDYILWAEDVVEVLVWKNADLSRVVSIRPDGKIALPLVGDIEAAGLTPSELASFIKGSLKRFKKSPEVSVIVKEINSLSVFVVGEVAKPGKLQLRSETTFLQAITLVGGFTEFAEVEKIVLLRRENGDEKRFIIDYNKIV